MRIRELLGHGGSLHAGVIRQLSVIELSQKRERVGGIGRGGDRVEHEHRMIKRMG